MLFIYGGNLEKTISEASLTRMIILNHKPYNVAAGFYMRGAYIQLNSGLVAKAPNLISEHLI
jgi:hypothetical protein